jgi:hypothetical protein
MEVSMESSIDYARDYLKEFMLKYFNDKTFGKYIESTLAGDFAVNLVDALEIIGDKEAKMHIGRVTSIDMPTPIRIKLGG